MTQTIQQMGLSSPGAAAREKFDLIAAPFTAFDPEGNLAPGKIEQQAQRLADQGIAAAFICGTTGEGMSLTLKERMTAAELWKEAAGNRLQVIVHVGHTCLEDSQILARHAEEIGADAIASIGPVFFTPSSPLGLLKMLQAIAASSSLPFYYYHMPSMARVPYKASELFPSLIENIPTFAGIKYTHDDIEDFGKCVQIAGDTIEMLFGRDEILLDGIKAGAVGAVGSTYNYRTDIYRKVLETYRSGRVREAEFWQQKAQGFINLFLKYGGLNAGKALMKMSGIDCGAPRYPLAELNPGSYAKMKEEFVAAGFFDKNLDPQ